MPIYEYYVQFLQCNNCLLNKFYMFLWYSSCSEHVFKEVVSKFVIPTDAVISWLFWLYLSTRLTTLKTHVYGMVELVMTTLSCWYLINHRVDGSIAGILPIVFRTQMVLSPNSIILQVGLFYITTHFILPFSWFNIQLDIEKINICCLQVKCLPYEYSLIIPSYCQHTHLCDHK